MPASMIIAPVGSSLKVSGSSIAMVADGPRPGSTPMMVPSTTPTTHIISAVGVSATWKPCINPARSSMSPLEPDARGQRDLEGEVEQQVEDHRAADGDGDRHLLRLARHDRHDEPRERGERDHEPDHLHQRDARGE